MVNENLINLVNNKKPVELVQELKDYELKVSPLSPAARKKVINKSGSNYVSENKEGYGPCPDGCYWDSERNAHVYYKTPETYYAPGSCTCDTYPSRFCLFIKCHNWVGDGESKYACSTSRALKYAHDLEDNNWHAANVISDEVLRKCATLVREAVQHYDRGNRVKGYVKVEGRFWTGYEWSINY